MRGGLIMGGGLYWSNIVVKEKVGLFAVGEVYRGGL